MPQIRDNIPLQYYQASFKLICRRPMWYDPNKQNNSFKLRYFIHKCMSLYMFSRRALVYSKVLVLHGFTVYLML